ncbi:MAG: hypothetical protein D6796_16815 [Caldilineae bacterium]|nr:MAG: hypothetical protein D6796_16815 [Caldilineae bacterium]
MFYPVLRDPAPAQIQQIGHADLVIGIATDHEKPAIVAGVARQAIAGAQTHFPHLRTVLLNADTGLKETVRRAVAGVATPDVPVVTARYTGIKGRGSAVCALLDAALRLDPQAILLLDAATESITPTWIPGLATLVLNRQADLVKPRYHWPLPDGALSDLLFFPFARALWGANLRHPAAPDFALSPALARTVLEQDVWETEVSRFGLDIWLSIFAISRGWKVAQTALGEKKTRHSPRLRRPIPIFKEAVGAMLRQVHLSQKSWLAPSPRVSIPTLTEFAPPSRAEPIPANDCHDYIEKLALGWMAHRALWKRIMLPETLAAVEYLASHPPDRFYFPPNLWAKIAYDFAVVYNKGERDPDAIAASLYPLYLGRLAAFWSEVAGLTPVGRAGTVAAQAVEFEELVPYLQYRWETYLPWVDSGEVR